VTTDTHAWAAAGPARTSPAPAGPAPAGPGPASTGPASTAPLDPADWEDFRALGKRMIDDVVDQLASLRDQPVWQPVPAATRAALSAGVPRTGTPLAEVYQEFLAHVRPYPRGNSHPRFWGWVNGSGLPAGVYADLLASAMNATVGAGENAAMLVEEQVTGWLMQAFGWPATGSGLLTSGSSMGHIVALGAARVGAARVLGWDMRESGAVGGPRFTVFASAETHHSVEKALELLGFGRRGYRCIPVDSAARIDVRALRAAVSRSRRAGEHPLCVVGNVGTVNTGAVDPLGDLLSVARDEGLWLHLDGAFGAAGYLVPHLRTLLARQNEADSLTFDLHKWFYLPFDASVLLVRQAGTLEDAYRSGAGYTSRTDAGPAAHEVAFADRGIEQSRRFRALKVWFALKTHGLESLAAAVAENVAQVQYLNKLIAGSPQLETVSTSPLNVTCFRYAWPGATPRELDQANREILGRLQTSGAAMPSHTVLGGRFVIRVAHTNHRTLRSDFDLLIERIVSIGAQVAAELTTR